MQNNNKIKIKLILSGSGAKGAYHYGFIQKLINNEKYEIIKIFSSSIGSINALLLSKNDFDNFWEKYYDIVPKNAINIVSNLVENINIASVSGKYILNHIDSSLSYLYSYCSKEKESLDFTCWNNFLDSQIKSWCDTENTISFSISIKTKIKTEIYEFNNDLKQNIPINHLCKYIKDNIMSDNIYNHYDNTYLELNNKKNEFAPIKSIIDDAINYSSDSENTIYILLSLESEENILDFISCKYDDNDNDNNNNNSYNDLDYVSYFYKRHTGKNGLKDLFLKRYVNFFGSPLFIFQLERQILEDYDENYLQEFIMNCIDNGKHHFEKFDEIITENGDNIFIFGEEEMNEENEIDFFE
jgi:hypothetical protein